MTVKEALRNMVVNFWLLIAVLIIKMITQEVALAGKNGFIKTQLKAWKSTRDVLVLESFFHRGKFRRDSYEIFHYVNNTWIARLCNLHNYKYQRHINLVPTNVSGSNNKR